MIFHFNILIVALTVLIELNCLIFCLQADYVNEKDFNRTLFLFNDVKDCVKNEFFDLNYFQCSSCHKIGENLLTLKDKFSCDCRTSPSPISLTTYDAVKPYIVCHNICNQALKQVKISNNTIQLVDQYCQSNETALPTLNCKFNYINRTLVAVPTQSLRDFSRRIEITQINWQYDGLCDECNVQYNFYYQGYCIANSLLRPYLSYNSFWQATSSTQHFGELKFVAFFCISLKNQTACNQLANLCVLSHFATDKSSPCSKFLLSQATDAVYRFGSQDDVMAQQKMTPFLYFSKDKETLAELGAPIKGLKYSLDSGKTTSNRLNFFANTFALEGTLLRWGSFNLNGLNLCSHYKNSLSSIKVLKFAHKYEAIECSITLEDLIGLAKIYGNNRFTSLYLNYTRNDGMDGIFLKTIPVLIEDLIPENQRSQKEDWQLVKRFQLIQYYSRHNILAANAPPMYEDSHKLLLFRSIRYAEKIKLHYDIYDGNRISIPLLKIQYRHIPFTNNTTLNTKYNFKLEITFKRVGEMAKGELINEIALPVSLFLAVVIAFLKATNTRKRRSSLCATTTSSTPLTTTSSQNNNEDFWHFTFFGEFLLNLISYMALAFLMCFLLHVFISSLSFLSQSNVELTLPIVKDPQSLELIIYAALLLKLLNIDTISHDDPTLKIFYICLLYILIYICQFVVLSQILTRITGNPIQKYMEHCSLANVSVFTLIEPSFGFYLHGRSPHGFADSDMTTMIMQLQRETQSICGRRGLLSDSDQCYVIMPPRNLSNYFDKLLLSYQKLFGGTVGGGGGSNRGHFQKEMNNIEGALEKTSIAYCSVNRFFCAFIDHGIKDMDYIIKEKTIIERLLGCEFQNYLTDNKGTFYIDTCFSFTQMFLYGNELQLLVMEFLLLLAVYLASSNLLAAVIAVVVFNKILQACYRFAVKENISNKTLIDKRFLM